MGCGVFQYTNQPSTNIFKSAPFLIIRIHTRRQPEVRRYAGHSARPLPPGPVTSDLPADRRTGHREARGHDQLPPHSPATGRGPQAAAGRIRPPSVTLS